MVGQIRVGGFLGYAGTINQGTVITKSYWDKETSGQTTSAGGEGRTTQEMTSVPRPENTYVDWNFDTIWDQVDGKYPWLRGEN